MADLYARLHDTAGVAIPFFYGGFALAAGLVRSCAGLVRANAVHPAMALSLAAGACVFAIGAATFSAGLLILAAALTTVGLVPIGRQVLAESTEDWEHTPEVSGFPPARRALIRPARWPLRAAGVRTRRPPGVRSWRAARALSPAGSRRRSRRPASACARPARRLRLERLGLRDRGALGAGDDRAGVAHRLAGRRGEAGDVADDRLGHVLGDELGGLLLGVAADLAAHHDQLGLGVVLEEPDHVDEARARDRVAADADDRRVAEAALGQLVADLVGQRARARDDADVALLEERRRDDPDVGLARRQHAGAVGPDEAHVRRSAAAA